MNYPRRRFIFADAKKRTLDRGLNSDPCTEFTVIVQFGVENDGFFKINF